LATPFAKLDTQNVEGCNIIRALLIHFAVKTYYGVKLIYQLMHLPKTFFFGGGGESTEGKV